MKEFGWRSGGYLEEEEVPRRSEVRLSWELARMLWYWLACATSTSVTFWLLKWTCCQLFYYLEDFYFHLKSKTHIMGMDLILQGCYYN